MKNKSVKTAAVATATRALAKKALPVASKEELLVQYARKLFEIGNNKAYLAWKEFKKGEPRYSLTFSSARPYFFEFEQWANANIVGDNPKSFAGTIAYNRDTNSGSHKIIGYEFAAHHANKNVKVFYENTEYEIDYEVFSNMQAITNALRKNDGDQPVEGVEDVGNEDNNFAFEYQEAKDRGDLSARISVKNEIEFERLLTLMQGFADAAFIRERSNESGPKKVDFFSITRSGEWHHRRLLGRPLDSVALKADQKTEIVKDIQNFLDEEESYARLSFPYRRGYLVHGPPGTGKTSLVKALATHFDMNLYSMNLSSISNDQKLETALRGVVDNSIVLIEDIDSFGVTKDRDSDDNNVVVFEDGGITLSGILNAIDGIATPHGLVVFALTNKPNSLDPALVRTGRLDNHIFIDYASEDQVNQLFEIAYNQSFDLRLPESITMSTSDVTELFKGNFHDPDRAAERFRELVANKLSGG